MKSGEKKFAKNRLEAQMVGLTNQMETGATDDSQRAYTNLSKLYNCSKVPLVSRGKAASQGKWLHIPAQRRR